MVLELRQAPKLVQQLVITPQLQQAIRLLQLTRLELVDMISQEMKENPLLEEVEEGKELAEGEACDRKGGGGSSNGTRAHPRGTRKWGRGR
jgi:RNA polymerase sigma-54 factor